MNEKSFWQRNQSDKAQRQITREAKKFGLDKKAMNIAYNFFKKEWRYPTYWWTGEEGLNKAAIDFWFPQLGYK